MTRKLYYLFLLAFVTACEQPAVWEKTVAFPRHEWAPWYKPWITLEVNDTASLYNLFAVVRHGAAFRYNNLLMNYTYIVPGDTAKTIKVNLPLGDNKHWLGDTLGEIIETRVKVNSKPVKLKSGNNIFVLQQLMPGDALQHLLNIGVRIEKVNK